MYFISDLQVLNPKSALIIVDVQNDFISGSLAIKNCPAKQDGEAVVPLINTLLEQCNFDLVVYSCDWHPKDHISFVDNVKKRSLHASSKVVDVFKMFSNTEVPVVQ